MRLDLFLKASRLCSRRSTAQNLCDAQLVFVNERPVKSSHQVKPGEEITIRRRDKETTIRVVAVPTVRQTARKEAAGLYQLLHERALDPEG